MTAHDGAPYHHACARELFHPRCAVCSEALPQDGEGRIVYKRNAYWEDDRYCGFHADGGGVRWWYRSRAV